MAAALSVDEGPQATVDILSLTPSALDLLIVWVAWLAPTDDLPDATTVQAFTDQLEAASFTVLQQSAGNGREALICGAKFSDGTETSFTATFPAQNLEGGQITVQRMIGVGCLLLSTASLVGVDTDTDDESTAGQVTPTTTAVTMDEDGTAVTFLCVDEAAGWTGPTGWTEEADGNDTAAVTSDKIATSCYTHAESAGAVAAIDYQTAATDTWTTITLAVAAMTEKAHTAYADVAPYGVSAPEPGAYLADDRYDPSFSPPASAPPAPRPNLIPGEPYRSGRRPTT